MEPPPTNVPELTDIHTTDKRKKTHFRPSIQKGNCQENNKTLPFPTHCRYRLILLRMAKTITNLLLWLGGESKDFRKGSKVMHGGGKRKKNIFLFFSSSSSFFAAVLQKYAGKKGVCRRKKDLYRPMGPWMIKVDSFLKDPKKGAAFPLPQFWFFFW